MTIMPAWHARKVGRCWDVAFALQRGHILVRTMVNLPVEARIKFGPMPKGPGEVPPEGLVEKCWAFGRFGPRW